MQTALTIAAMMGLSLIHSRILLAQCAANKMLSSIGNVNLNPAKTATQTRCSTLVLGLTAFARDRRHRT